MIKIKILIADQDLNSAQKLGDFLNTQGFDVRLAAHGNEAKKLMKEWGPRLALVDMVLPEANGLELLEYAKNENLVQKHGLEILMMSAHNNISNVKLALNKGAQDYLVKPYFHEDVLKRLVFLCRSLRYLKDFSRHDYAIVDEASLMLHLTNLILRLATCKDSTCSILFNLTRMVAMKVAGVRCSIIYVEEPYQGVVMVSSDSLSASGIRLDLNKYPEVLHVHRTGHLIAIENLEKNHDLKMIKGLLKDVSFNSMIVCPIQRHHQPFGVLSLRMPREKETMSDNEMRFVEIVGHVTSLVLNNEKIQNIQELWGATKSLKAL